MTLTLSRAPRRAATAALAALSLVPLAGCGGDEAGGVGSGESLARLAPASSIFYFEAAIRPEGDREADVDRMIKKFAPDQDLDKLLTRALQGSSDELDYSRDVKPWLGERVAVTLTGLSAVEDGEPDFAAIMETTDVDKAMATLRQSAEGTLADRSYNGVEYLFDSADKFAGGIVEENLVVATEPALRAVVDATKGDGLDENAEYAKVSDAVDEDALALIYGDLGKVFDAIKSSRQDTEDAQQFEGVRELLDRQGLKTFAAGLTVTDTSVKLRAATPVTDGGQGDAPAETMAALPAGSWAALGLGDLGKSLSDALDGLKAVGGPGLNIQSGLDQLERQAGIDVQKDLLSWMGQSGLFLRGTSLTDIGGALVVQSKDPAATKAALAKARTIVAGAGLPARDLRGRGIDDGFSVSPGNAPVEVFAALAGERFVLAVNRASLDAAINPTRKLEDDDAFKAATEQLGDGLKPRFFLDFPKVSGLIGAFAGNEPGYARVKPYLDKITTIVAGSKREGDLQLQTLSVGVR